MDVSCRERRVRKSTSPQKIRRRVVKERGCTTNFLAGNRNDLTGLDGGWPSYVFVFGRPAPVSALAVYIKINKIELTKFYNNRN
jgi:hypothetical protein